MKEQIKGLLETLKDRVQENLSKLKKVEVEVKSLLTQPVSEYRSSNLTVLFEKNKMILQENQDALKIQLQLIAFLNKYYSANSETTYSDQDSSNLDSRLTYTFSPETNNQSSDDEDSSISILHQTLSGDITYDSDHPLFDDPDFYNLLMNNYILMEKYEMCAYLKKMKQ